MTNGPKSIPDIHDYSQDDLIRARQDYPAIHHYLDLIQKPAESPAAQLRQQRHHAWLRAALATYFKNHSAETICAFWSEKAKQLIQRAWQLSGAALEPAAIFAMGKLGAEELNLSSDVDLVIVSQARYDEALAKSFKQFRSLLADLSELGFCLRLDFDLRPGGRMGPLISTPKQFEDYYWSQGETWERLAFVRFQPICGDAQLIDEIMGLAQRFSYRKFLDYTLLDDLKQLRSRIHRHSAQNPKKSLHLKLDIGGIRDIELFVHALQVIHGGRDTNLRSPSTTEAIKKLISSNTINSVDLQFLHSTYWEFRQLENELQAANDQQTHSWSPDISAPQWSTDTVERLRDKMQKVDQIVSTLLGQVDLATHHLPETEPEQQQWLIKLGYSEHITQEVWPQLMSTTALSYRSDRDEAARREFLYHFVNEVHKTQLDQNLALSLLLDFVKATRAKATFFTLLLREPRLLKDLARLFSSSPYLGGIIASRPELIDSFILRVQEAFSEDPNLFLEEMTERRMLTEIIASNQFIEHKDVWSMTQRLTDTADLIGSTLLRRLKEEVGSSSIEILALGKWGSRELGLRSDLDFIFVVDSAPTEVDHKIAKRFISRLSAPHRGGKIYDIDMRLRPSGSAGPLLVKKASLSEFLSQRAEAWVRQSYLRARFLNAQQHLNLKPMLQRGLSDDDMQDLVTIRKKLLKKATSESIDLKLAYGGLVDIELTLQVGILRMKLQPKSGHTLDLLQALSDYDSQWKAHQKRVTKFYSFFRQVEQMFQLASSRSGARLIPTSDSFQRLSHMMNSASSDLNDKIISYLQESVETLKQLDQQYHQG